MYCKKCGRPLGQGSTVCHHCGTRVTPDQTPKDPSKPAPKPTFFQAVKLFFVRYLDFSGRSRRSEYWYAQLFQLIVFVLLWAINYFCVPRGSHELTTLVMLAMVAFSIAIFLPDVAIMVRRLHDSGKSGWLYLLSLIPFGNLVLLIFMCLDSTEDNQWGADPTRY